MGPVQVVQNYPRTLCHGAVYEWRITSSYYKDERYAKRISDVVSRTLSKADYDRIVSIDDNFTKTYYLFLNDSEGTVLVNRYGLTNDGVWCVYHSNLCTNVTSAHMCGGTMIFCAEEEVFWFDPGTTYDAPADPEDPVQPIPALWESGYQAFGEPYRRKYSSQIYLSVKPSGTTAVTVTASTDRREEYMEKTVSQKLFSWSTATFPTWTFATSDQPKLHRIRLKVKKFIYYKLILKVDEPGATATILGYDQQVRFSSMAK